MRKRFLGTVLSLALVSCISVMGTLAYLTDRDSVANTFTVGNVNITLDEADVDEDGKYIYNLDGTLADRVDGNEYHLIPGQTYVKDPTVTVKAGSEESYVRMEVEVNCLAELDAIFAPSGANLLEIFNGYDENYWELASTDRDATDNTVTYEFRYINDTGTVEGGAYDIPLKPLFESFTLPGVITGEQLKMIGNNLKINVYGHAIQAATFDNADAAWAAFDQQVNP